MQEILLSISFAWKSLAANSGRTILTLSGVIIGTLAILSVSALGDAVEGYVLDEVNSFGNDTIQIEVKVPSTSKNSSANAIGIAQGIQITTLTEDDARVVAKLSNVRAWYGGILGQSLASYRETNKRVTLLGASASAPLVDANARVDRGDFYSVADEESAAQVVVLGSNVREAFFGDTDPIGKTIKLQGKNYRVMGTLEKRGSSGFVSFDDFVYVPLRTLQKKILGIDYVNFITVRTRDESKVAETALDIESILRDRHDIRDPSKDDFAVTTIKEAQDLVSTVFGAVQLLLLALASISLVVGGVGIMNVMFVSVAERLGEIGLRKAVGARPKDILRQFLLEAIVIATAGGIIGMVLAFLLISAVRIGLSAIGFAVPVGMSFANILLAIGFAGIAGVLFGIYPAWKASRITPVEAIRGG